MRPTSSNLASKASAGGQLEHPSEVNSSTTSRSLTVFLRAQSLRPKQAHQQRKTGERHQGKPHGTFPCYFSPRLYDTLAGKRLPRTSVKQIDSGRLTVMLA